MAWFYPGRDPKSKLFLQTGGGLGPCLCRVTYTVNMQGDYGMKEYH